MIKIGSAKTKAFLLLAMSADEAFDILDIDKGTELDKTTLKKAYRKASQKVHPDRGGSKEDMQQVNLANEKLKEALDNKTTNDNWKIKRDLDKAKYAKFGKIIIELMKKYFKPDKYKTYFEKYTKFPLEYTEDDKINDYYSSSLSMKYEFFNEERTTVFSISFYVDLTKADLTKSLGGGEDGVSFPFSVDHYLYHNKRKQKMKQRTWSIKNNTMKVVNPKDLFPQATMKKVFEGKKQRTFKKRDMIEGLVKELKASWDGDFMRIPIKDEIKLLLYRSTMMRQGMWGANGIYNKHKRVETLKVKTLYENEEKLNLIIDTVKAMKKKKTEKQMADVWNRTMEKVKYE